jgi:hypothetical protein
MMNRLISLLLWVTFISITPLAMATIITVGDNVADDTYISHGSTINGEFDINSALSSAFTTPYDINSGMYEFQFTDDGDLSYTHTTYTSYQHSGGLIFTRYIYDYYVDENELIQISIGGEYSIDSTDWYSMTVHNGTYFDGVNCGGWLCWGYYSSYNATTEGNTGTIRIQQYLNDEAINDLAVDGVLPYTLTATEGDIIFNYGELTVDANPNYSVPEPTTFILMVLGLVGLGFSRSKRLY